MAGELSIGTDTAGEPVRICESLLGQHTLVFGGSGYGKSYFSYLLVREQLKRGASLVALDPKRETVRRLRGACHETGIPPERVVVIDGAEPQSAPGLNPFLAGGDPAQVAADVLDLFAKSGALTGDRMAAFLTHAVRLAAWHALPLSAVPRLLLEDDFRQELLAAPPRYPADELYAETAAYFTRRFTAYKPAERESSALSVETKFSQLLGNRLFLRMFNAAKNTLDFDDLFRRQGAVLATFGKGGGVTEQAGQLLAALIVHFLDAAAQRRPGTVPVVLATDEFRKLSGFLEEGLRDVANMARERGIRLLVAAQHPGQIPDGMRADLLVSSAVKAYFNPGGDSVDATAKYLAEAAETGESEGEPPTEETVLAQVPSFAPYRGKLYARHGDRLHDGLVPLKAAYPPPPNPLYPDPQIPSEGLRRFAAYAPDYLPPLYLEDGRLARDVLHGLPEGCAFLLWRNGFAHLEIAPPDLPVLPAPPKPARENPRAYWTGVLRSLGKGEIAAVVGNAPPRKVRVHRVAPPEDAPAWYLERSRRAAAPPAPSRTPVPPAPAASKPAAGPTGERGRRKAAGDRVSSPKAADDTPLRQGAPAPPRVPVPKQPAKEYPDDARSID